MMNRWESFILGHAVWFDEPLGVWRWADTNAKVRRKGGVINMAGRVCPKCGLLPTSEDHDPCIANLPGVAYACCGHGVEQGYVKFTDGRVIRGKFDDPRA